MTSCIKVERNEKLTVCISKMFKAAYFYWINQPTAWCPPLIQLSYLSWIITASDWQSAAAAALTMIGIETKKNQMHGFIYIQKYRSGLSNRRPSACERVSMAFSSDVSTVCMSTELIIVRTIQSLPLHSSVNRFEKYSVEITRHAYHLPMRSLYWMQCVRLVGVWFLVHYISLWIIFTANYLIDNIHGMCTFSNNLFGVKFREKEKNVLCNVSSFNQRRSFQCENVLCFWIKSSIASMLS